MIDITLGELIRRADIPRELYPEFHKLRVEAFTRAMEVYEERAAGYNIDHEPWQEQVFGPVSLVSEIFKRSRRMASLLSPLRETPVSERELNGLVDASIDMINYLSWLYSLIILATGVEGNENNDDAPDYIQGELPGLAVADEDDLDRVGRGGWRRQGA